MEQIQIHPNVAIAELEALVEFWRNRSMGNAQLSFLKDMRIQELENIVADNEENKPKVVKTKEVKNDGN